MCRFWKLLREEKAAAAVEYALIVGLIALAALGALVGTARGTTGMWNGVSQNVTNNM